MDEELAEHLEENDDGSADRKPPTLSVSETTPEVLLLLRLVALGQAQLQAKQAKRIPFPPLPSIRTARAAVQARLRAKHRGRLAERVAEGQALWSAMQSSGGDQLAAPDPSGVREWLDESDPAHRPTRTRDGGVRP